MLPCVARNWPHRTVKGLGGCLLFLSAVHCQAQNWPVSNPSYHAGFPVTFPPGEGYARYSSIAIGDVNGDGLQDIVVGTSAGYVEVYKANGGRLWGYKTGSAAIESKPLIADLDGDGSVEVIVSAGSTFTPSAPGGVYIINSDGQLRCAFHTLDINQDGVGEGAFSTPALGALDPANPGKLKVVFGAWDTHVRAMNSDCSLFWDKSLSSRIVDTVWSSPAIGDVDGDGTLEVVIGMDSQQVGPPYNTTAGGMIRAFHGDGKGELSGFPVFTDEVIYSSPVLANIDNDPQLEIIVGTGQCWDVPACAGGVNATHTVTDAIYAIKYDGKAVTGWPVNLTATGDYAFASPAVADLDGDGVPEIIINTVRKNVSADKGGWTYVYKANGTIRPGWPKQPITPADCSGGVVHYGTPYSPIVADLTGDGLPEIILPSNGELVIWDGNGTQLSRSTLNCPNPGATPGYTVGGVGVMSGSAAVGDLNGDGKLQLVSSSSPAFQSTQGALFAWDFNVPIGPSLTAWPEFRRDRTNRAVWRPDRVLVNGFE